MIPYITDYAELPRVHTNIRGFCNHSEKEVQTEAKLIMKFIGILLCLLVLSIQVDGAKKKLLKKLAKELGYKLEEAIKELKISIWFDAFRTSVDFENTSGPWKTITYTGLRESKWFWDGYQHWCIYSSFTCHLRISLRSRILSRFVFS